MRIFWISLFIFVLLLCSCKSKEVISDVSANERVTSNFTDVVVTEKTDTTKVEKVEQTEEFTRIYESETITEYDTEKGVPSKVTEKKKITEQGKQAKAAESEERRLTEVANDSLYHFADVSKMIEKKEEVKDEQVSGKFFSSVGKWVGIGLALVLIVAFIWKKVKK